MRNKEKEDLMEAVFGKNAKRRTLGTLTQAGLQKSETEVLSSMLKQQSDQLNQMMKDSAFTESDYQKLKQEIEKDFGVSFTEDDVIQKESKERNLVMSTFEIDQLVKQLAPLFPGQEMCVENLVHAFSKPFVLKNDSSDPMFVILLCGKAGTGKSEMLMQLAQRTYQKGYLHSKDTGIVDLSLYSSSEQDTLFVQDVYAAMNKGDIIIFKNLHKASFAMMPTLESIVKTGNLKLPKRYVFNKGMLQEAGSSLNASLVDSLSFANKGIVFMADAELSELHDTLGTGFLKGFHDIIETHRFTDEALMEHTKRKLHAFCEECMKLNMKVSFSSSFTDNLKDQFDERLGLESLDLILDKWLKALLELKVAEKIDEIKEIELNMKDGQAVVMMNDREIQLIGHDEKDSARQEQEILNELNEIVGLDEVKKYVLSLKDHFRIQKLRAQKGLKTSSVSMHMIFTGNPGTGKTTIARIISRYLKAIGILSSGQLVEVTRADLVGRYVGHTAPLTESVIHSALGGVLFIDEAYSLYRGKDDSFGLEAIDTLVKCMEDLRDDVLVILAGYTKEMKEFLSSNSGLKSRFPNVIEFPDYTAEELLLITKSIAKGKQYVLHSECDEKLLEYFKEVQSTHASDAGNGRLARNLVEAAILKQSTRCLLDESALLDELKAEDFELEEVMEWQ